MYYSNVPEIAMPDDRGECISLINHSILNHFHNILQCSIFYKCGDYSENILSIV